MAINLIYFSGTGNTKKVVEFVGKQWGQPIYEIDLSQKDIQSQTFSDDSRDIERTVEDNSFHHIPLSFETCFDQFVIDVLYQSDTPCHLFLHDRYYHVHVLL